MNDALKRCGTAALSLSLTTAVLFLPAASSPEDMPIHPEVMDVHPEVMDVSTDMRSESFIDEEIVRDYPSNSGRTRAELGRTWQNLAEQPNPSPMVESKLKPVINPGGTRSARGSASWYCKAGVSICHYRYPPGSMVAAACSKLRAAMGSWRGKTVTVSSGSRTVTVKLVDWCGSRTKIIDLYWEPMRRLGGTGVLPVIVRW